MRISSTRDGLVVAALTLCACAGPGAEVVRTELQTEADHRFPRDQFIVGIAEGTTREQASAKAQTEAAGLVRSEVSSRFRAEEEARKDRDGWKLDQNVLDVVERRVSSAYGAFFEVKEVRPVHKGFVALAVASRAKLDKALAAEAEKRVAAARPAFQRVLDAATWLVAAPAFCAVKAAVRDLDSIDLQRLAVSGRRAWTDELQRLRDQVHARYQQKKGTLRVVVTRPGGDVPEAAPFLVAGLRNAGWNADAGSSACAGEAVVVEQKSHKDCRHSSLGVDVCRASASLEARSCDAQNALFSEKSGEGQATSSSDPDAALRRATKAIPLQATAEKALSRLLVTLGERCDDAT